MTGQETAPGAAPVGDLREGIVAALRRVYDPEIPVNIYDLGLVYAIDVGDDGRVDVRMTLTAPGCPVAGSLPGEVEERLEEVQGVREANVELVWEPAWSPDVLSEDVKLQLGLI
jgi:FeS assembly SUF system protein